MDRWRKLNACIGKVKTQNHADKIIKSFGKDGDRVRAMFPANLPTVELSTTHIVAADKATRAHLQPGTKMTEIKRASTSRVHRKQ